MKKGYTIRDIDPLLWKEFKAACAHYKISMRHTFIKLINNIAIDYMHHKKVSKYLDMVNKERGKK